MQKVCKIIFILVLMFCFNIDVKADMIKVEDIVNNFKNNDLIKVFNELGFSLSAVLDEKNNKINVFSEDISIFSVNYTDDYLEYDNRNFVMTEESVDSEFLKAVGLSGIIYTIFEMLGFKNIEFEEFDYNFDEYGILMEVEPYEFNTTDEEGMVTTESGEYIEYLKLSRDSTKLVKLANDYGVVSDSDTGAFIDLIPSLKASDITSSSITLYPRVDGFDYDSEDEKVPYCEIYKATSPDGEYEKVDDSYIVCSGNIGIIDEDLASDTTYYYKAMVVGGKEYSEVLTVTTLKESFINEDIINKIEDETNKLTNPKTGNVYVYFTIGCLLISLISFVIMFRYKFNKF